MKACSWRYDWVSVGLQWFILASSPEAHLHCGGGCRDLERILAAMRRNSLPRVFENPRFLPTPRDSSLLEA